MHAQREATQTDLFLFFANLSHIMGLCSNTLSVDQSSLFVIIDLKNHVDSEDSDQTELMPRLISVSRDVQPHRHTGGFLLSLF